MDQRHKQNLEDKLTATKSATLDFDGDLVLSISHSNSCLELCCHLPSRLGLTKDTLSEEPPDQRLDATWRSVAIAP